MSAADMFWAAPPVSRYAPRHTHMTVTASDADPRTLTAAAVLLSVPAHMSLIDAFYLLFYKQLVFTLQTFPQIWRLVTPFILTGPKLGLILDPYFLYTYGSQLEMDGAKFPRPGDFFTYVVFVATVILVSQLLQRSSTPRLAPTYISEPRIICPYSQPTSCHGSWKRGRLPLHCAPSHHSQNCQRDACGVQARWDPALRITVCLESLYFDGGFWALHLFAFSNPPHMSCSARALL